MVQTCIVCKYKFVKGSPRSFHSFPTDECLKRKWSESCNLQAVLPSQKICSFHFSSDGNISYNMSSRLLKKTAVPLAIKSKQTNEQISKPINSCVGIDENSSDSVLAEPLEMNDKSLIKSTVNNLSSTDFIISKSPLKKKRHTNNPRWIGDCIEDDFVTPRRRKRNLNLLGPRLP